jgi:hypothetical protein
VDKPRPTKPRIEYVAPSIEMVEDFAGRVCRELAARSGDPRFLDAVTIKGFATFLRVLLTIEAKRRNREASFDSSDEIEVQSAITQTAECVNTPPS